MNSFEEKPYYNRNAFKIGFGNWNIPLARSTYNNATSKGYMRRAQAETEMEGEIESDCWKITVTINGKNYVLNDLYKNPRSTDIRYNNRNKPRDMGAYMRRIVPLLGVGDKITLTMFHDKSLIITYKRVPVRGYAFYERSEKWIQ